MKNILITGATGGLGEAFTKMYDKEGNHLFLHGTNVSKLENFAKTLTQPVTCIASDFSQSDAIDEFCEKISKYDFDIVINNAGIGLYGEFIDNDAKAIEQLMSVNIIALTKISHTVLNNMKKQKSGYLVHLGSVASFFPGPMMSVYYASKAYVLSLSESLTMEMKDYGVIVSCLCPGPTKTSFHTRANMQGDSAIHQQFTADPIKVASSINKKTRIIYGEMSTRLAAIGYRVLPRSLFLKVLFRLQKQR